jgi:glucan phosphoethanolaminetransferase (alkaline phosphatase superfamily)
MIQRKQTIWLFLAAFISGALFIFPLYHYSQAGTDMLLSARSGDAYELLLLAALMTILPMIAIFMFKNRGRQKALVWLSVLANVAFIAAMIMKIQSLKNTLPPASNDSFALPGPILPILSIVLLIMAFVGIRKDEALLKSVDRLR